MKLSITLTAEIKPSQQHPRKKKSPAPPKQAQSNSIKNTVIINPK